MLQRRPISAASSDRRFKIPSWSSRAFSLIWYKGGAIEQPLLQRLIELLRHVLGDVADLPILRNAALLPCSFHRRQELVEDIGESLRADPVDVVEMHADD